MITNALAAAVQNFLFISLSVVRVVHAQNTKNSAEASAMKGFCARSA